MLYRVIERFKDLEDGGRQYQPDDYYPRFGLSVSPARIESLASKNNKRGVPLIEEIPEVRPRTRKKKE